MEYNVNTKDYEEMVVVRQPSKYPKGLRHFSKESIAEDSLFSFELIKHFVLGLLKGVSDEEENKSDGTPAKETTEEICDRYMF